ncbi:MAG: hypothetical protein WD749_05520 [Phycisphaerales bacterium]
MSGLRLPPGGISVCPECGRRVGGRRELLRSPRRVRWARLALAAGLALAAAYPYARSGRWVRHLPTVVLAATERLPPHWRPARVRRELESRLYSGVDETSQSVMIPRLIADLRADDRGGNALRAVWLLTSFGEAAVPALERSLASDDWQERHLAAAALADIPGYEPVDAMLRVCVEGLRDDSLPYESAGRGRRYLTYSGILNARTGTIYLAHHADQAAPFLERGLESDDPQQRLLCAVVVAYTGPERLRDEAVAVFLPCLRDNKAPGDAVIAAPALYRLGGLAEPHLRALAGSGDRQERRLAARVLAQFDLDRRIRALPPGTPGLPPDDHRIIADLTSLHFGSLR